MARKISIETGSLKMEAHLNDSSIAQTVWEALPIEATCNTWGEEIYFSIPVGGDKEVVDAGDIGYWSPGNTFCIFFGPTPASQGQEIRLASAVTLLGRMDADLTPLRGIRAGARIVLKEYAPG